LVVSDVLNDRIWVVLNNGNYDFTTENDYATGPGPANFAVGDVNRDGFLDLVVANSGSTNVSVLLNDGVWGGLAPGSPALLRTYATSDTPLQPAEIQHLDASFPLSSDRAGLMPLMLSSDPAVGSARSRVFSDLADSSFDDVFVNDLVLTVR